MPNPIALTPNQIAATNPNIANNAGNIKSGLNFVTPQQQAMVAQNSLATQQGTNPLVSSPTTISNANAISKVGDIITKTNSLDTSKGLRTDANGNPVYSNGTAYNPPPGLGYMDYSSDVNGKFVPYGQANTSNSTPNTYTDYFGNTVPITGNIPAGSVPDGKGNYLGPDGKQYAAPLNDTSYNVTYQQKQLADLKTSVDSNTASIIDSIGKQYSQLMNEQQQVNSSQIGKVQNALLMGGVTGQGSTAQFASTSADSQVTQQMNYGVQQIQKLQNQEDQAINAAKLAQEQQDYQIVDKQNALAESLRVEKVTAAQKLSDQINAATEQNQIDNAVTKLYTSGTTNPSAILKNLTANGVTANGVPITLKDIQTSLTNQVPQGVSDLMSTIEKNGASSDIIAKVMASPDLTTAIKNAGNYIQTATGPLGDYLQYQRQGGAENYEQWTKSQEDYKNQEAIKLEYAKQAITNSNTGLSSSDITSLVNTLNDYQGKKYLTSTDLTGYDTKQKASLITALKAAGIQTLSPKDSDAINTIQTAQSDLQGLSTAINSAHLPHDPQGQPGQYINVKLNQLLQTDPNLASYKTQLLAVLPTLSALKGVGSGGGGSSRLFSTIVGLFPQDTDTLPVAQKKLDAIYSMLNNGAIGIVGQSPAQIQKQQDADNISSIQKFHDASPANATMLDNLHKQFPNASPSEIKQALGIQ